LGKTFSVYRAEFKTFNEIIAAIEEEAAKVNTRAGAGAAAGVATGVALMLVWGSLTQSGRI